MLAHCRDASFHFWDATDDINGASLDLLFERDRLYLHNARGSFGAVPMNLTGEKLFRKYVRFALHHILRVVSSYDSRCACAGDLDLHPDTGEYRLSATVPGVEVNQLRATLGVRPTPQPVAGGVAGLLHVTGPLEKPIFSGSAWAVRPDAAQLADCEVTEALAALLSEQSAVGAWDRLPLSSAGAVFTLDTTKETLQLHSAEAELVDGGQVRPPAAWAAASHDPNP
jgi:hypothetical protein